MTAFAQGARAIKVSTVPTDGALQAVGVLYKSPGAREWRWVSLACQLGQELGVGGNQGDRQGVQGGLQARQHKQLRRVRNVFGQKCPHQPISGSAVVTCSAVATFAFAIAAAKSVKWQS